MDIDSPRKNCLFAGEADSFLTESPSFLPPHMVKQSGKSRPDFLSFKRSQTSQGIITTSTLKRPLQLSPRFDSPTCTLAADLSQNFHIDQHEKRDIPTPKRYLFGGSQAQSQSERAPLGPVSTNRKINSRMNSISSLGSTNSIFSFQSQSTCSSQSSISIFEETESKMVPPAPSYRKLLRRANTVSVRSSSLSNISAFQPNRGQQNLQQSQQSQKSQENHSDEDLDALCIPSPVVERDISIDNSDGDDSANNSIGSPLQHRLNAKLRLFENKPSNKARRTHSMFQTPQELYVGPAQVNSISNDICGLSFKPAVDPPFVRAANSVLPSTKIRTFMVQDDLIPRIDTLQFVDILQGKHEGFDSFVVVDCRFEYEYRGGHIDGSVNITSQTDLEKNFLTEGVKAHRPGKGSNANGTKLVIFHCEFSSYRGPLMANHLRNLDRSLNKDNYPYLYYPDVVILQGGYKQFFDQHSELCYPKRYVEMNDSNHIDMCEMELERIRRDFKLNSKSSLKRAMSLNSGVSTHQIHTTTQTGPIGRPSTDIFGKSLDALFENTSSPQRWGARKPQSANATTQFEFKFPLPKIKPAHIRSMTYHQTSLTKSPIRPIDKHVDTPVAERNRLGEQNRFKFPKC
ncbi:unnamed protein product [Kuraishia capsulata CBS 1993]|uniref:M-phase inducer phosphatase n=1 Tax=Kuraishia capsulata CBS 1993 TaxID=1382522 RepID=W6MFT3_9ASCO|nr:uncharacterized protein KUCA_T00000740001 [Kuraishia capsulata CBS 1993]CDK24774.1 unnamed protein product [Kuraishia capsulata CBS 1993]